MSVGIQSVNAEYDRCSFDAPVRVYWEVPVAELPELEEQNRDHAYILEDESIWVMNFAGDDWIQLNAGGGGGTPVTITSGSDNVTVTRVGNAYTISATDYAGNIADLQTLIETIQQDLTAVIERVDALDSGAITNVETNTPESLDIEQNGNTVTIDYVGSSSSGGMQGLATSTPEYLQVSIEEGGEIGRINFIGSSYVTTITSSDGTLTPTGSEGGEWDILLAEPIVDKIDTTEHNLADLTSEFGEYITTTTEQIESIETRITDINDNKVGAVISGTPDTLEITRGGDAVSISYIGSTSASTTISSSDDSVIVTADGNGYDLGVSDYVQGQISPLTNRVTALEDTIETLTARIEALENA